MAEKQGLKKYYLSVSKYGYPVLFALWFVFEMFFTTTAFGATFFQTDTVYLLLRRGLKFALLAYLVFFQRYTRRELLILVPATALFFWTSRVSAAPELFYGWLLIVGAKNTDFVFLARLAAVLLAVMVPLTVILNLCGVIVDRNVTRGGLMRYAFGFVHPNRLGLTLFVLTACLFCAFEERPRWWVCLLAAGFSVFSWFVPNSRTSALCTALLAVLAVFSVRMKKKAPAVWRMLEWVMAAAAVVVNTVPVGMTLLYDAGNKTLAGADRLLSGRLFYGSQALREAGLSAFGRRLYLAASERAFMGLGSKALPLDDSYVRLLLNWGIPVYVLVSAGVVLALLYQRRRKSPVIFTVFFVFLLYASQEATLWHAELNTVILAAADLLYGKIEGPGAVRLPGVKDTDFS